LTDHAIGWFDAQVTEREGTGTTDLGRLTPD
jgi:hypothetical protein